MFLISNFDSFNCFIVFILLITYSVQNLVNILEQLSFCTFSNVKSLFCFIVAHVLFKQHFAFSVVLYTL